MTSLLALAARADDILVWKKVRPTTIITRPIGARIAHPIKLTVITS